jgi:hypothetical protein
MFIQSVYFDTEQCCNMITVAPRCISTSVLSNNMYRYSISNISFKIIRLHYTPFDYDYILIVRLYASYDDSNAYPHVFLSELCVTKQEQITCNIRQKIIDNVDPTLKCHVIKLYNSCGKELTHLIDWRLTYTITD